MSRLGRDAARLVKSGRRSGRPTSEQRRRVRAAILTRAAATAAAATTATAAGAAVGTATAKAATGSVAVMWKLGVVGVAVASVAAGGLALTGRLSERDSDGGPPAVQRIGDSPRAAPSRPVGPTSAPDAGFAVQPEPPAPLPITHLPRGIPRQPAPAPSEPPVEAAATDDLVAQVELLSRAVEMLGRGDPAQALVLLDEHEARFPISALAAERERARARARRALEDRAAAP